jgi:hypothetical protein
MTSLSVKAGSAATMLIAGPAIDWAGHDATRSRALAVAVTALATLLLSAVGVTGARTPPVPLNADRRADRSRNRFKRLFHQRMERRLIGTQAAKV